MATAYACAYTHIRATHITLAAYVGVSYSSAAWIQYTLMAHTYETMDNLIVSGTHGGRLHLRGRVNFHVMEPSIWQVYIHIGIHNYRQKLSTHTRST